MNADDPLCLAMPAGLRAKNICLVSMRRSVSVNVAPPIGSNQASTRIMSASVFDTCASRPTSRGSGGSGSSPRRASSTTCSQYATARSKSRNDNDPALPNKNGSAAANSGRVAAFANRRAWLTVITPSANANPVPGMRRNARANDTTAAASPPCIRHR